MLRRLLCPVVLAVLLVVTVGRIIPARADPSAHVGYGMMLAYPPGSLDRVPEAGFDWYKYFLYWEDPFGWELSLDGHLSDACSKGLNLVLRVERWHSDWTPIQDHEMDAWRQFFQDVGTRVRQKRESCGNDFRVALEVWNEPNLDTQWWGEPLSPARYTEMVQNAYLGTKAGDTGTIVVAGGLAPTGGDGAGAMSDVQYLEEMYDSGLQGYFDAISTHSYGFGGPPEDKSWGSGILNFRRAEDIYAVMVAHGDGDKQVWATEFGWLLDASEEGHPECVSYWDSIGFGWQRVSAQQQADYLVRAFRYADANWPWMGVMVVSNLDFSVAPWGYPTCEPLRWFSLLRPGDPDPIARPAYSALQEMAKRYRSWSVWGMGVRPLFLTYLVDVDEPGVQTTAVSVQNTSVMTWHSWSLVTATQGLIFTVVPTGGVPGDGFTVQVDSGIHPLGSHTAVITVEASEPRVPESPVAVPVTLFVWTDIYRTHVPLVLASR